MQNFLTHFSETSDVRRVDVRRVDARRERAGDATNSIKNVLCTKKDKTPT